MVLATECPSPYRNWTPGSWSSSPPRIDASSPRSCTFSPVRPPMIKSTVSGGALVTSSPSDAKSTRQRGVKHSITKRFTRRARWEVRLVSLGPRKPPSASCRIVEPQVAEVLVGADANPRPAYRSWPKIVVLRAGARKGHAPGVRRGGADPRGRAENGAPPRAPVRRTVQPVGGMALRSGPYSGILLGTPDSGHSAKRPSGLCRRTLRPYSGGVGRAVANRPKAADPAPAPARTVLSAARRVSAALAENPHHGRS